MSVRKDLFDIETYAIYGAMSELFGKKGCDAVWGSGEIAFADLKKNLNTTKSDPMPVMKRARTRCGGSSPLKEILSKRST